MRSPTWVTAAEIDNWAESTIARGLLPELMRRLVLATVDRANLQVISFPAREEVQRHGYDGTTSTDIKTTHVPQGPCVWKLSCEDGPRQKAERDYQKRLENAQGEDLSQLTYFAITARDWEGAAAWAQEKTVEGKFKEGVPTIRITSSIGCLTRLQSVSGWLSKSGNGFKGRPISTPTGKTCSARSGESYLPKFC